jgi:uracil-DNA glycosylase
VLPGVPHRRLTPAADSLARLVHDLAAASIGSTFNFLRDEDPELDVEGGAAIRRGNLLRYLESRSGAGVVAVGEAGGYRGARFSGIAFTSERTLASWGEPYAASSRRGDWPEPSATIVHRVLGELGAEEDVLLWNTVPTHPHRSGEPLTNRRPTAAEIAEGAAYARRLLELVRPRLVVAVGGVARVLGEDVPTVRHPANAGAAQFADGMRRLFARREGAS